MKIDFFAREQHHIEHALTIYEKMPEEFKGKFLKKKDELEESPNKIVAVFCYGDLRIVARLGKKAIFGDHGVGMYYNEIHPSYAGSLADRDCVLLRLSPNKIHADKEREILKCPIEIIGVPKMDKWHKARNGPVRRKRHPVIAFSFHWDCRVVPETRSKYKFYENAMKAVKEVYGTVLGHGHPRIFPLLHYVYRPMGIRPIADFNEIIKRADIYICDNSSTLFEFAYTKKPVILLNYPFYRKDVEHEGNPRFWRLANMGVQVDSPDQLLAAIQETIDNPRTEEQEKAVEEMFYYLDGKCTERAVNAIVNFLRNYDGQEIKVEVSGVQYGPPGS